MNENYYFRNKYNKEFSSFSKINPCLCGSITDYRLFKYDRHEHLCPTVLCEKCGLVRSNPRISSDYMIDFYESDNYRNFTTSNKTKVYSNYFRTSKHIYKILSRYIKPKSKILEIGCGGGWNLIPFLRSGHTIYGTEYSKELKKISKYKGIIKYDKNYKFSRKKFDLIIVSHVLEHLYDINNFLNNLKKILKDDGYLYIEVPSIEKKYSLDQIQFFHNYYFTKNTLISYCLKSRFKVFKWSYVLGIHQFIILKKYVGYGSHYNKIKEVKKIKELHRKYFLLFYRRYLFNFYFRSLVKKLFGEFLTTKVKFILKFLRTSFL